MSTFLRQFLLPITQNMYYPCTFFGCFSLLFCCFVFTHAHNIYNTRASCTHISCTHGQAVAVFLFFSFVFCVFLIFSPSTWFFGLLFIYLFNAEIFCLFFSFLIFFFFCIHIHTWTFYDFFVHLILLWCLMIINIL